MINLTDEERDAHYQGSGYVLASFFDRKLTGMMYLSDNGHATIDEAIQWMSQARGQTYTAMASCAQLVNPEPISAGDTASLARLARIIGDANA